MLPVEWKKEIENAVDKAGARTSDAENRAADANRDIAAGINALTDELKRRHAKQEGEEPARRRRENCTIGALAAAAVFTLALAAASVLQTYAFIESERAFVFLTTDSLGPIPLQAGKQISVGISLHNTGKLRDSLSPPMQPIRCWTRLFPKHRLMPIIKILLRPSLAKLVQVHRSMVFSCPKDRMATTELLEQTTSLQSIRAGKTSMFSAGLNLRTR